MEEDTLDFPEEEFTSLLREHPTVHNKVKVFGKEHDIPRFERLYGTKPYSYSGITRMPEPVIPPLVQRCLDYAKEHHKPEEQWNGALVNWYMSRHHSIGAHSDDERDLVSGAPILSFSFGGARTFRIKKRKHVKETDAKEKLDIQTGHGMILAMCGNMQKEFTHEVTKTAKPVEPRINITIRAFREKEPSSKKQKRSEDE
jgi:alkylated DNA repair dioxygenase AlkB